MDFPKPKPPVSKLTPILPQEPVSTEKTVRTKPPFVLRPHLTDQPLRNNPDLQALKAGLKSIKSNSN